MLYESIPTLTQLPLEWRKRGREQGSHNKTNRKVARTCLHCGAGFHVFPVRIIQGRTIDFCNQACRTAYEVAHAEERYWKSVDCREPWECWPYIGYVGSTGYGVFQIRRKPIMAHVYAWQLVNGPVPKGLFICHRCDVRNCCNPAHLFAAPPKGNSADMVAKGRQACGEHHGMAKLTESKVREIRTLHATGMSKSAIARQFDVTPTCIRFIITGYTWSHVD